MRFLLFMSCSLLFAADKQWYQGGTLHKKTGREWVQATPENRIATTSDFVAAIVKVKSMGELKIKTVEVERCITKALERPKDVSTAKWQVFLDRPITEYAGACMKLLGY